MDLFDYMRQNTMDEEAPLASRMRPATLDEVVGQQHIIGKGKLLYRAIRADKLGSLAVGKQGDLVIWDAPDLNYICYRMGSNLVRTVIKNGKAL